MTNQKKNIILVVIVFSILTTLIIFQKFNTIKADSETIDYYNKGKINQRYVSLLLSSKYWGLKFPESRLIDPINQEKKIYKFIEPTVILLISNNGCNPCQIRELKNLNKLRLHLGQKVKIIVIYVGPNLREAMLIKKVSKSNLQFLIDKDSNLDKFVFTREYPVLFFLNKQMILSNFLPIAADDEFSELFYKNFSGKLNEFIAHLNQN